MTKEDILHHFQDINFYYNDCMMYDDLSRMLDELIAEIKDEWIPVSERLPEINKEVIVTDVETSDTYQSRYIGNGYWECDNGLFKNRIIAWQPKLKPYKAERGETR